MNGLEERLKNKSEWRSLLEDIIYGFNKPVAPCFYDWVVHLIEVGQLKLTRFKLPEITDAQEMDIRGQVRAPKNHYYFEYPRICYALHQRGYKYDEVWSEVKFKGTRPDLLAVPCKTPRKCRKEIPCEECKVGNGLGFIAVEVGSLTTPDKIFTTRDSSFGDIKEFWLVSGPDDFVYVFIAEKGDHEAWNWLWKRWKEIAKKEVARDKCWTVISGGGCSDYPDCYYSDGSEKPCYWIVKRTRAKVK